MGDKKNMDSYKVETIIGGLIAGIGVLWHQMIKQVGINRTDQKYFSETLARTMEVISENNSLMRENTTVMRENNALDKEVKEVMIAIKEILNERNK